MAFAIRAAALLEDCRRLDVVICAVPNCAAYQGPELVLDRFDIIRNGATALTFEEDTIRIERAATQRGSRPWSTPEFR